MFTESEITRFWSKVDKGESCWIWKGSFTNGYGVINIRKKTTYAHHISYKLATNEEIATRLINKCGTIACVNPDHYCLEENISGKKFNRLTALEKKGQGKHGTMWLFECECGVQKEIRINHVKDGRVKSCGCFKSENNAEMIRKFRTTHEMTDTRFYHTWEGMKARCYNPKSKGYNRYGGRGIKMSESWLVFDNFYRDMYDSYLKHSYVHSEKNTTIERNDSDKDYCLENCRWVTNQEQQLNRSDTVKVKYKGRTVPLVALCKQLHVNNSLVGKRLGRGWTVEDAVNLPRKKNKYV